MLPFRFYLITDRQHARHDTTRCLPQLAAAGLRALQIREKDLSPGELFRYCRGLQAVLGTASSAAASLADDRSAFPQLYLNDRADLALALGFAGVQLREDSLPLANQAALLRQALYYGVSTHSVAGALAAARSKAQFAIFGPVHATPSKLAYGEPVGLAALAEAAAAVREYQLPLLALGGITPERVPACLAAGAWGVAAISAIWNAEDPVAQLLRFREALGEL